MNYCIYIVITEKKIVDLFAGYHGRYGVIKYRQRDIGNTQYKQLYHATFTDRNGDSLQLEIVGK